MCHTEPEGTTPYVLAFVPSERDVTPTAPRLAEAVAVRCGVADRGGWKRQRSQTPMASPKVHIAANTPVRLATITEPHDGNSRLARRANVAVIVVVARYITSHA
jgi:hypothetical protein